MEDDSLEQKFYWLQQQINTAVLFIGLATFFVGLKFWASMLRMRKTKASADGLSVALIFPALVAFLLLGVTTICECLKSLSMSTLTQYLNSQRHGLQNVL